MKIRTAFVSNSSSSSFLILADSEDEFRRIVEGRDTEYGHIRDGHEGLTAILLPEYIKDPCYPEKRVGVVRVTDMSESYDYFKYDLNFPVFEEDV